MQNESKINFDDLIVKIDQILSKGQGVKMKNKFQFESTLQNTKSVIKKNKGIFNSLRREPNMIKIFTELEYTVQDLESKLNKLALISFCRSKAEKYLANVTSKLENINMVLLSFLAGRKGKENADNTDMMNQINALNDKINSLKLNEDLPKPILTSNEEKLFQGLKYLKGVDTRVNYKLAYELFSQVAEDDNNNIDAKVLLAQMYENGYYVEKSYIKAHDLYSIAAENGNANAMYKLGCFAEKKLINIYNDKNYEKAAMDFYVKAAESGYTDALAHLGYINENGLLGHEPNIEEAVKLYKNAIEIDENPIARNFLGNYYYNLYQEEQDVTKRKKFAERIIENYTKSAQEGNIDAINNLGTCYEYGVGVAKSIEKAMMYYNEGTEKNHPISMSNKAILMIKMSLMGERIQDYHECFKLLQISLGLDKLNKEAYYYLGFLFEMGYEIFDDGNVTPNPILAFYNYKKAAELGHTKAKMKVGVAIYNGIENCFRHDEEKGVALLKEAAEEGDKEAVDYLEMLKQNGKSIG